MPPGAQNAAKSNPSNFTRSPLNCCVFVMLTGMNASMTSGCSIMAIENRALATNPGSSELAALALVRFIENRRSPLCLQECRITRHTQPVDRAYCVILI
jgi:hypothetical protein